MSDTPRASSPASVFSLVERRPPVTPPWSPEEMLVQLLEEVRAGKVKPECLMIFFMEGTEDGRQRPQTWSANVSRAEAIAFCTLEIHRTIDDWRAP